MKARETKNINQQKYLDVAFDIGKVLCRDAIWSGDMCNWVAPYMEFHEGKWQTITRIPDGNLYGGTSGIALFLGYLYHFTKDEMIKKTAVGAMNQAINNADQIHESKRIGFHTGSLGIVYSTIRIGELMPETGFIEKGFDLFKHHLEYYLPNEELDILTGSGGAIPIFTYFLKEYPQVDIDFENLIKLHSENIIAKAEKSEKGWSWDMPNMNAYEHLLGFSHGAAGVALALLEASIALEDESLVEGMKRGFDYEEFWFDETAQNYPDMRDNHNQPRPASFGFSCQWCHGAAGILLSRCRAWKITKNELFKKQTETAASTTINSLKQPEIYNLSNYCLCHGFAGNAACLLYGYETMGNEEWYKMALEVADQGIERIYKKDLSWPIGVTNTTLDSPSLMLGNAGIGYFYLRLFDPETVPPILIIES